MFVWINVTSRGPGMFYQSVAACVTVLGWLLAAVLWVILWLVGVLAPRGRHRRSS